MSADNGIYLIQSLDGWRVTHAQAIENIYFWEKWDCCNNPVPTEDYGNKRCRECGEYLPIYERKAEMNPKILKEYFSESKVYNTEKEVMEEAIRLYEEIMKDDYGLLEYGICYIKGWEDKIFPE